MKFKAVFYKDDTLGNICIAKSWCQPMKKDDGKPIVAHYIQESDDNGKTKTILKQLIKSELEYFETNKSDLLTKIDHVYITGDRSFIGKFSFELDNFEYFYSPSTVDEEFKFSVLKDEWPHYVLYRNITVDISDTLKERS